MSDAFIEINDILYKIPSMEYDSGSQDISLNEFNSKILLLQVTSPS